MSGQNTWENAGTPARDPEKYLLISVLQRAKKAFATPFSLGFLLVIPVKHSPGPLFTPPLEEESANQGHSPWIFRWGAAPTAFRQGLSIGRLDLEVTSNRLT